MAGKGRTARARLRGTLAVLLIAVVLGFIASFVFPVVWSDPTRRVRVIAGTGRVVVMWQTGVAPVGWDPTDQGGWRFAGPTPWRYALWFNWENISWAGGSHRLVRVPMWVPMLCIAAPLAWLCRGVPVQTCLKCGYSLVGLPQGAPCPECGGDGR